MNSKQKIFIPFFSIFAAFFSYVCMQTNNGIILPSASACEHDGNHYRGQGNLTSESKPETFGHGIQEYYICCKCHEMFFAKDGVPTGKWSPIQDLGESIVSQIDENDPRATKFNVGNFLNLNVETIKMSSITGYDHEVAKVDGFGKIGFDGAYSNNSIHAFGKVQTFKTDGTINTLDNNFVRIYKDTVETQTISPNVWYTISIKVDGGAGPVASNQLNSIYMEFGEVSHLVTLQSLRFGTTWDSGFQAKKHGISTSDGLTQISRKTIGGEDLFTVYGNGNLYFDDVMSKDNVPGQFFLSNYKYVSFDIYSTYHDAPHAYVPYSDVWMHATANWSWASSHPEGLFVKSYQNQVEVDTFNVDQWYTFNFEIHNNINGAVRFELGATFTYITNVKFSVEPVVGETKTAEDKPDYDPLGFALNNTTSTMTKVEEDGKACMKVVTTGQTELYFLDIGTKIKQTDGSTKGVGGAYHGGYKYFSFDVKVAKGNNFYWAIPWEGIWHDAKGNCDPVKTEYLTFLDLSSGKPVNSIMGCNNWYRLKVKINDAQGNDWCMTWGLNDEGGTELYICNLQFYA